MPEKTMLYNISPVGEFIMSFVIATTRDNVIVIDGGRPEDMPRLREYIGGRHISAWILSHAHSDHISGFVSEMKRNGGADFDIGTIYYNFPPYSLIDNHDVPDYEYFCRELNEALPSFNEVLPIFRDKTHITVQGETLDIDEVHIEFLYSYHSGLFANLMNDSSLVFKLTTPNKTVLFLGDLGPDGGDLLFQESRHKLKSDIVQMAHHGHMNCGMEVYEAISPEVCLWCAPDWLYAEPEIPQYLEDREKLRSMGRIRMYGVALTRRWMEHLGARQHYVTCNGTTMLEL